MTYDTAKTELVLFFDAYQQRLNQELWETIILIKGEKIKFKNKTICWLEIWLDSQLKFTIHINKRLA